MGGGGWLRVLAALGTALAVQGQTTQGLIGGHVRDADSGRPIAAAEVSFESLATNQRGRTHTGASGAYNLPLLPPGTYRLTVSASGYQTRAIYQLELAVAGYLEADFELRPLGLLWEKAVSQTVVLRNQSVLSYFGPDVDPGYAGSFDPEPARTGQLEPSLSGVVDPRMIADLPLTGRDVYTALVLMPGVTADTATARSLGLSSNGQRPTSSNFLMDGLESNNHLISGPALSVAPEAVQEYRVSTNNFSAEYGRTSGQVANAVTRSGGKSWHGVAYWQLKNEALDANSFQHNLRGLARAPLKEHQAGGTAGGPLVKNRLYQFAALEYLHSHGLGDPAAYVLPSQSFASSLAPGTIAAGLFRDHPPIQWGAGSPFSATLLRPSVTYERVTGLERLDYQLSDKQHLLGRLAGEHLRRPDFVWSPYDNSPLGNSTVAGALTLVSAWSPQWTTEVRAGFQENSLGWNQPLPDVPNLEILGQAVVLPGAANGYSFTDHAKTIELAASALRVLGRHVIKAGGGVLGTSSRFSLNRKATLFFADADSFGQDRPLLLSGPLSRIGYGQGRNQLPNGGGQYRDWQYTGFVQEDFRWTERLTLSAGWRVDAFGAPRSQGANGNLAVVLGAAADPAAQVQGAATQARNGGGVFPSDAANWAVRLGTAVDLRGHGRTLLRGGYGVFHDRWFDNIWTSSAFNELAKGSVTLDKPTAYLQPLNALYSQLPPMHLDHFYNLTAFASPVHTPLVRSVFVGLQQRVSSAWSVEGNVAASWGRQLLTNDIVNRQYPANGYLRRNRNIAEDINYRANQGTSDYSALILSSRYRSHRALLDVSYSWSHSIDNQSDPLLGDFFDLGFTNQIDRSLTSHYYAGFSREFDAGSDRGNADFDQRHNLVVVGSWSSPRPAAGGIAARLIGDWTVSGLYALRSGLPYTVFYGGNCVPVCNTRPDLVGAQPLLSDPRAATGGVRLLDAGAFALPAPSENGNLGRNTFRGPGFQNLDVSLARAFRLAREREARRLIVRADFFNAANHANLNNPQAFLGAADFGIALRGRIDRGGFPALTPLNETARRIALHLRLEF